MQYTKWIYISNPNKSRQSGRLKWFGVVFVNFVCMHAIMYILSTFTAKTLVECEWASKETPDTKL